MKMTHTLVKLAQRLKKNLKRTSTTPEQALHKAKSWQIAAALLLTASVGTYLLTVAIAPTAIALAMTLSKGLPIMHGIRSVLFLVEFYLLAWFTYALLDMAKDFTRELRHRVFGL